MIHAKKENSKVAVRMLAALMILKDGKELRHTAKTLRHCTNPVRKWVDRFEEHGLDGLCNLPEWKAKNHLKEKNGFNNVKSNANFVYTCNASAEVCINIYAYIH